MDKIFLIDKNVLTYNQIFTYLNDSNKIKNLSEFEYKIITVLTSIISTPVFSFNDLIKQINSFKGQIVIESSGTSGKPKKISHNISNLVKNIKISEKFTDDIWVNTYNPDKMAFYQIFFQVIFNQNTMVNCFGVNFSSVVEKINLNNCSHISATPTFYKMLIAESKVFNNIKQVSIGGEPLQDSLLKNIKIYFPNSKIKNIYASSEASSLFASNSNIFTIPNNYKDKIKIKDGQLILQKELLGDFNCEEWFETGDLVEFITENSFKFIGRNSFLTKIAGYLINPIKIEEQINELLFVKICKIYEKKNSVTGNILICDIILNENIEISKIKKELSKKLNKYEIPSIFRIVNSITLTESGKIKR
jgi:acyl-CoA synthetase (AMP-forming)/AMP-acid ligase II